MIAIAFIHWSSEIGVTDDKLQKESGMALRSEGKEKEEWGAVYHINDELKHFMILEFV